MEPKKSKAARQGADDGVRVGGVAPAPVDGLALVDADETGASGAGTEEERSIAEDGAERKLAAPQEDAITRTLQRALDRHEVVLQLQLESQSLEARLRMDLRQRKLAVAVPACGPSAPSSSPSLGSDFPPLPDSARDPPESPTDTTPPSPTLPPSAIAVAPGGAPPSAGAGSPLSTKDTGGGAGGGGEGESGAGGQRLAPRVAAGAVLLPVNGQDDPDAPPSPSAGAGAPGPMLPSAATIEGGVYDPAMMARFGKRAAAERHAFLAELEAARERAEQDDAERTCCGRYSRRLGGKFWRKVKSGLNSQQWIACFHFNAFDTFTRTRRLTLCLLGVMLFLLCSAMFYSKACSPNDPELTECISYSLFQKILLGVAAGVFVGVPMRIFGILFQRTHCSATHPHTLLLRACTPSDMLYDSAVAVKQEAKRRKSTIYRCFPRMYRLMLPYPFVFLWYLIAIGGSAGAAFLVMLYGLWFTQDRMQSWLISAGASTALDNFVEDPLMIIGFAVFGATVSICTHNKRTGI